MKTLVNCLVLLVSTSVFAQEVLTTFSEDFEAAVDLVFWTPNTGTHDDGTPFFTVTQEQGALKVVMKQQEFHNGQMYDWASLNQVLDLTDNPYFSIKIKVEPGALYNGVDVDEVTFMGSPFEVFQGSEGDSLVRQHSNPTIMVADDGEWHELLFDWSEPDADPATNPNDYTNITRILLETVKWPDTYEATFWIDDFKLGGGELKAVESFEYSEGALGGLGEATDGWGGAWDVTTSGSIDVFEGTVALDEIPIQTFGNYIEVIEGATTFRYLAETWPDDGSTYWICLFYQRIDDTNATDTYNGLSLFLNNAELLYIGKPWATLNLGLDCTGVTGMVESVIDAYEGGWMVVKLVMTGDGQNDDAYLWINPDPAIEPDEADADAQGQWNGNGGFNRVRIGSDNPAWIAYDEIRMAQSFKEIVDIGTIVSSEQIENIPDDYRLKQNYPNPFNPTTTIEYSIPSTSKVRITVFDLLGREIATLVNEQKAAGVYQVNFDGATLTCGVYLYRLETDSQVHTQKMMLLK